MTFVLKHLRTWLILGVSVLWALGLIHAQESASPLNSDAPVSGALSADNIADVYRFDGSAGADAGLVLEGEGLGLVLTALDGTTLGEALTDDGSASIAVTLPATDGYQVTVFGAGADAMYSLSLVLEENASDAVQTAVAPADIVTQLAPPTDILVNNGIEVRLQWDAVADLNLEVRDPRGNALYFDNRTTQIGGSFGFDANGFCEIVSDAPAEAATWQPGFLPTGSYEILVFYRESCDGLNQPVEFTLTVTVDGIVLPSVSAVIPPPSSAGNDSVYLANFVLASDATGSVNEGGVYPDAAINQLAIPASELSSNTVPVVREQPVQGAIFEAQDVVVYSFEAQADEIITISMDATSGNLDTLLQLVDPSGNLIAVNDDFNDSTNSRLSNVRIIQTGVHYILATRYGKGFGGTEGEYQLFVTETSAAIDPLIADLNLPSGDIEVFLTWATNADLQLLVRDPVGQSVYDDEPQINSGGILAANGNVNCQVSEGNPISYIYWPSGLLRPGIYEVEIWFQNTCNDTRIVESELTIVVNGRVVTVDRQIPSVGDRYILTFTVNADGTAVAEQGGFTSAGTSAFASELAAETPLTIQFNQPVNGSITLENDFDVYAFQGEANQTISVFMEATSQTLDTNVYLLDENGIEITSNDDAEPGLVIGAPQRSTDSVINSFTLPADGVYRIVATRFGTAFGGTVGTYRLTLQNN